MYSYVNKIDDYFNFITLYIFILGLEEFHLIIIFVFYIQYNKTHLKIKPLIYISGSIGIYKFFFY